jgi:hypothetical protein
VTGAAWLTLLLITGFVWGGFAWVLGLAVRKESEKEN